MSALTPPLVWLLRDHADECELVMKEGDEEVSAAYDNEEEVYDQEADRLLEKHAQALVDELVSPGKHANLSTGLGRVLTKAPHCPV